MLQSVTNDIKMKESKENTPSDPQTRIIYEISIKFVHKTYKFNYLLQHVIRIADTTTLDELKTESFNLLH